VAQLLSAEEQRFLRDHLRAGSRTAAYRLAIVGGAYVAGAAIGAALAYGNHAVYLIRRAIGDPNA